MLGSVNRCAIFDGLRAVAKTRRLHFWKATARADPMPPSLQPVMRTVLSAMIVLNVEVRSVEMVGSRAEGEGEGEGEAC